MIKIPYVKYLEKRFEIKGNYLDLKSQGIKDITLIEGLEKLTYLEALNLGINQISEIRGLENLHNLKRIYLYNNLISEIKGLEKLQNLESLELSQNQISEIKGLEELKNLKALNLSQNQISEIKGLEELQNLEALELSQNQISEIKDLKKLLNLELVKLNENQINEIKGLEELKNLKILDLSHNQISEIKGLEELKTLKALELSYNQISEIKGLEELKYLEALDLRNEFTDPNEVYLIEKRSSAQEIVEYCKFKKLEQSIPFIDFDQDLLFEANIDNFRKYILNIPDFSFFVNLGTHKESNKIKSRQNALFLITTPSEFNLQQRITKDFKDIIIHLIQIHSLKGIKLEGSKLDHFNFFIRHFWDNEELDENNVLIYKKQYESRVNKKIEEFLDLSIFNYEKPDIIILPENSIPQKMIKDLEDYSTTHDLMIIGGLEHVKEHNEYINKAIIIDNGITKFQVKQTPVWIWDKKNKDYLKENIKCESLPSINVFNTSLGRMAIFICKDFLRLSEIIPYWVERNQIDLIIIPSLTTKVLPFQARLLSILNHPKCKNTKFLFSNIGEYSGSELFSVEDNLRIEESHRSSNHDNIGETIVIRKIKRIKAKYLELIKKEMEICKLEPEKIKKLKIYEKKVLKDKIPYTFTRNISIGWDKGNPHIEETYEIKASEIFGRKVGYCIRCRKMIPLDRYKPYCRDDWLVWVKWEDPFYIEKYCHKCGKSYAATKNRPYCDECYWN